MAETGTAHAGAPANGTEGADRAVEPAVRTIASTSQSSAVGPSSSSSSSSTTSSAVAVPRTLTSRPARKQVSHREVENLRQSADKSNQSGLSYNIWYNKWSGGDKEDGSANKTKAKTRVDIARDAGFTRANAQGGAFICLFFSRGYCPNGSDCTFLHTLPTDSPDQGHDIFGRAKHGDYRDDMGGVGSVQRVNRTLYVGRFVEESDSARVSAGGGANLPGGGSMGGGSSGGRQQHPKYNRFATTSKGWDRRMSTKNMSNTEKVLYRHFGEFGELERIRVLHTRGCGFVTYVREVDAQFAKEAMMNQSLDHDECINLRWATDDPNPGAQKRDKRQRERQGIDAIRDKLSDEAIAAGHSLAELDQASRAGENGGGAEKRLRIDGGDASASATMTEEEYARLVEENRRNWEAMEEQEDAELQARAMAEAEAQAAAAQSATPQSATAAVHARKESPTAPATGFFDAAALEALQAMRARQAQAPTDKVAKPASALGGLADYGSDSEDE